MKIGDWVEKVGGDYDLGRIGVVRKIEDDDGAIVITVFSGNEIKGWSGDLVRVIGKSLEQPSK